MPVQRVVWHEAITYDANYIHRIRFGVPAVQVMYKTHHELGAMSACMSTCLNNAQRALPFAKGGAVPEPLT
jgi:hypothetical protein